MTTRRRERAAQHHVSRLGARAVVVSVMCHRAACRGLPRAAYLCRLLRRSDPDVPSVVAPRGGPSRYDDLLVRLRRARASHRTTSLAHTEPQVRAAGPAPAVAVAG